MRKGPIRSLKADVIAKVRSGHALASISQVVAELIANAIDAKGSVIRVEVVSQLTLVV
jgi:DNA mismatch repair ATPase MutL